MFLKLVCFLNPHHHQKVIYNNRIYIQLQTCQNDWFQHSNPIFMQTFLIENVASSNFLWDTSCRKPVLPCWPLLAGCTLWTESNDWQVLWLQSVSDCLHLNTQPIVHYFCHWFEPPTYRVMSSEVLKGNQSRRQWYKNILLTSAFKPSLHLK